MHHPIACPTVGDPPNSLNGWTGQGIAWVTYPHLLSCPHCMCLSVRLSPRLSMELALPCSLAPSLGVGLVMSHPPSTAWSLLGLGAGFALLAVPSCRAVGSPLVMDPNSICRKTKRLAGKQAELCQLEPEIVQEVAKGTKLGVRECQYQFRFRRWNCTSHSKYFGKILQQGKASASSASQKNPSPVTHLPGTPGAEPWRAKLCV